jgi:hypothetical protein
VLGVEKLNRIGGSVQSIIMHMSSLHLHHPPTPRHHATVPAPVEVDVEERLLLPGLPSGYRNRLRLSALHGDQVEIVIDSCVFGSVLVA